MRNRYLLFKSPDKWINSQRIRAEILGQIYSHNYDKNVARVKLTLWFKKVDEWN